MNNKQKNYSQDLSEKEKESVMYFMWLLFENEPTRPAVKDIHNSLIEKFGEVDVVSDSNELSSFAIKKYISEFKDAKIPTQLVMGDVTCFEQDTISDFERAQLWDIPNSNELLSGCTHNIFISDMMDTLNFEERTEMLMDWLEVAVDLFPDCVAVWIPSAGKLISAQIIRNNNFSRESRFIHYGVNARFFNIQGGNDMMVDTRGMFAMGLPDIQCHYHSLDPNDVVGYIYNIASYIYSSGNVIENGDAIDGLKDGRIDMNVQWKCSYENSLVQPVRPVIDICPGQYAAGTR